MSEEMTRKEVIDWLYRLKSHVPTFMPKIWHEKFIKALQFAIASLETDEAYNLMYEQPEFVADCISRKDSGIRIAKNEYLRGWHDAICSALKEKYHIHCDEGDFTVIQEETLVGLGMSKDSPLSKSAEDFINIMPKKKNNPNKLKPIIKKEDNNTQNNTQNISEPKNQSSQIIGNDPIEKKQCK